MYNKPVSISVVINTRNEEENIERAIASVKAFADEIIVVDMESTDKTKALAKKLGAQVFNHELTNYVEPARNFAISKAKSDWILILDADEEIPKKLASEIKKISQSPETTFARIARKNLIFGDWVKHARWWPDYNIRFFKKGSVSWDNEIHSIPVTMGEGVNIDAEEDLAIVHHHYQSVEQYLERMNRYTTIQAQHLYDKRVSFNPAHFISRPAGEFMSRYFAGEGYKDGLHGLTLSLLQAFSETVLMIKLWQLHKFKKENIPVETIIGAIKNTQKEMNYWTADTRVKEGASIHERVKRKLKLH